MYIYIHIQNVFEGTENLVGEDEMTIGYVYVHICMYIYLLCVYL
jgi:hypothetical protein